MTNDRDTPVVAPADLSGMSPGSADLVPTAPARPAAPPAWFALPSPRRPLSGQSDEAYLRGVQAEADIDIAAGR